MSQASTEQPQVDEEEAPGWDALLSALDAAHPGVEELQYDGGAQPDQGVYAVGAFGRNRYWHLVTYGLSELFGKASDNPEVSGWGFELSLRIPREQDEEEPAGWAVRLLLGLGNAVFQTGQSYGPGHRTDLREAIDGGQSRLTAVCMVPDPQLKPLDGPFGRVEWLEVVGITGDELQEMQQTSTRAVAQRLAEGNRLLVTEPDRG